MSLHVRMYALPPVSTLTTVVPQAPPLPFGFEDTLLATEQMQANAIPEEIYMFHS
jgi:hypothetical protein